MLFSFLNSLLSRRGSIQQRIERERVPSLMPAPVLRGPMFRKA